MLKATFSLFHNPSWCWRQQICHVNHLLSDELSRINCNVCLLTLKILSHYSYFRHSTLPCPYCPTGQADPVAGTQLAQHYFLAGASTDGKASPCQNAIAASFTRPIFLPLLYLHCSLGPKFPYSLSSSEQLELRELTVWSCRCHHNWSHTAFTAAGSKKSSTFSNRQATYQCNRLC